MSPTPIRASATAVALLATLALLIAAAAPPAGAADPGRWIRTGADSVPLEYFQGLTHDPASRFYFIGIFEGAYRTDAQLREQARDPDVIPTGVQASPGFNHIGDPTYDRREGGRLLLPLECYHPGGPGPANTCGRGGIGVLNPRTLAWRYFVGLDPRDIPKAMWAEVSPDGRLLWTSSGDDLIAYRTSDISPAHAGAGAAPIRPVRRLVGAVPPSGVTGAAFYRGRLLLAGEADGILQVRSVSVTGPRRPRIEIELPGVDAESEGLDVLPARGGLLHWLFSPIVDSGKPTFGNGHSELLTFLPRSEARLRVAVSPSRLRPGRRARIAVRVTLRYGGRSHPVRGALVRADGRSARTGRNGVAHLSVRAPRHGSLRVRATRPPDLAGSAALRVRAPLPAPPRHGRG